MLLQAPEHEVEPERKRSAKLIGSAASQFFLPSLSAGKSNLCLI
jgi:hypothetical protein